MKDGSVCEWLPSRASYAARAPARTEAPAPRCRASRRWLRDVCRKLAAACSSVSTGSLASGFRSAHRTLDRTRVRRSRRAEIVRLVRWLRARRNGRVLRRTWLEAGQVLCAGAAGVCELLGGLLVFVGLGGPIGPMLIIVVMLTAAIAVHAPNGWFVPNGVEVPCSTWVWPCCSPLPATARIASTPRSRSGASGRRATSGSRSASAFWAVLEPRAAAQAGVPETAPAPRSGAAPERPAGSRRSARRPRG